MITLSRNDINSGSTINNFQANCIESAFEAIVSKCFIDALKKNIPFSPTIAAECADFSKKVIRNAGGISLLTNAIESSKLTDISKKGFLERFNNACVEAGLEMSSSMILRDACMSAIEDANDESDDFGESPEPEMEDENYDEDMGDISEDEESIEDEAPEMPKEFKGKPIDEIQLDTKISPKELDALKRAAGKIDLEEISQVVSDKVANVIQAEKVQRFKLNEEKERIKQAIIDDPNNGIEDENAAESAMETMLNVPVSKLDTAVYTTLFSTLQRRAVESVMTYERGNTSVSDILAEITVNNTFDIFKPEQMTFFDATSKAVEMTIATEACDDDHMENVIKNSTIFATIIYTLLETLHTMNLNTCCPTDVKKIITKNADDVTARTKVESKMNDYKEALEAKKRCIISCAKKRDVVGLENAVSDMTIIKGRLITAKESVGFNVKPEVMAELDSLIDLANNQISIIESSYNQGMESTMGYDKITAARESDISQMNSIARSLKYKTFDNIKFKCCESAGSSAVFSVSAEVGKTPVYTTELKVTGMESAITPDRYISYLCKNSKISDLTKANENIDICVVSKGQIYSIAD